MKITFYLLGGSVARLDVEPADWPRCERALAGDGILVVDEPDGMMLIDPHVLCWKPEAIGGEAK